MGCVKPPGGQVEANEVGSVEVGANLKEEFWGKSGEMRTRHPVDGRIRARISSEEGAWQLRLMQVRAMPCCRMNA